jgi:signal peptide peptidase SppA
MTRSLDTLLASIPHIDQYGGVWMVDEDRWRSTLSAIQSMDLVAHIEQQAKASTSQPAPANKTYRVENGIARFDFVGMMTKYGSSLSSSPSMIRARRDIAAAANDPEVSSILLVFDSPGGTSAGTRELADAVSLAATKKRVVAYADDLMASAAYFVASGATEIVASVSATVGSIGTYMVMQDFSGLYAKEGVKVHVIRAGDFKGSGTMGTEVTPKQIEQWQRLVDGVNEPFVAAVARGRKMTPERAKALADGRIHLAADAVGLGLADRVGSLEQVIEELKVSGKKGKRMSEENPTTAGSTRQAASYVELKAISADAAFVCECLEKGATKEEAQAAWTNKLQAQLLATQQRLEQNEATVADLTKQLADEKANVAAAQQRRGVPPLPSKGGPTQEGDPSDFLSLVETMMSERKLTKADAIRAAAIAHPEQHQEWLETFTKEHRHLAGRR